MIIRPQLSKASFARNPNHNDQRHAVLCPQITLIDTDDELFFLAGIRIPVKWLKFHGTGPQGKGISRFAAG